MLKHYSKLNKPDVNIHTHQININEWYGDPNHGWLEEFLTSDLITPTNEIQHVSLFTKIEDESFCYASISYQKTIAGNIVSMLLDHKYLTKVLGFVGDISLEDETLDPKCGYVSLTCFNDLLPEELERGYVGIPKNLLI